MPKFYQTPEFKELQSRWDEILIEAGFADAEKTKNGDRVLKNRAASHFQSVSEAKRNAKIEYFELIAKYYFTTVFQNPRDKFVLGLVAEGLNNRQIVKSLEKNGYHLHRKTVMFIVRRYEHEWGIRFWTAKQRNL
jgi:FixJ family two-component response regulator